MWKKSITLEVEKVNEEAPPSGSVRDDTLEHSQCSTVQDFGRDEDTDVPKEGYVRGSIFCKDKKPKKRTNGPKEINPERVDGRICLSYPFPRRG